METISIPRQQHNTLMLGKTKAPFFKVAWIRIKAGIVANSANFFCRLCARSNAFMPLTFLPFSARLRNFVGRQRLLRQHFMALKQVPAYRSFMAGHKADASSATAFINSIPVMDKGNYIRQYTLDACCVHGAVPRGCVIDESSGSTGAPSNWARGRQERDYNQKVIRYAVGALVGNGKQMIINAFALGPWATGMNISSAFEKHNILKSLGPDLYKIVNTLASFGPSYQYIIMGYPPFLKKLADTELISWKDYNVTFIFGGESMSEYMRDHIRSCGILKTYGSYGASDLELNMASENDFTIALRKLLSRDKALATELLIDKAVLPMVFQYNPADFYMETSAEHELLISLCRPGYVMPKIRYNIHDTAQIVSMAALKQLLAKHGYKPEELNFPEHSYPLLLHYGRSDMAVSFYGCKLCPQQVHDAVMMKKELNLAVNNFFIKTKEDEACNKRLELHIELRENVAPGEAEQQRLAEMLIKNLCIVNQDFRESLNIAGSANYPTVHFKPYNDQAFKMNDFRVKNKYIIN